MFGSVGLLVDRQRAAHQRLGLRLTVRDLEQRRQVVEVRGDVGMVGAVKLLVDPQCFSKIELGFTKASEQMQTHTFAGIE